MTKINIEGWEIKKLGEVATFLNGFAFKPEQWEEKGLPIIRIQNLNTPTAPYNYYSQPLDEKYLVRNGDLLISWSASLGTYIWEGEDAYLNQHIFKVVFDKLPIEKMFLKYLVTSKLEEMTSLVHGATMKHITKKNFDNIQVTLPPLPIQQRIVEELDEINAIISAKKQQLSKLDELAQSIFYNMFLSCPNNKEWDKVKMKDVANFLNGDRSSNYPSGKDFVADGVPFINAGHINAGHISFSSMNFITDVKYEQLRAGKVMQNDILFCLRGSLGKCAIVEFCEKAAIASSLVIIRCKEFINVKYLYAFLTSEETKRLIIGSNNGSSQPNLSAKSVASFPIPLPPLPLQETFASRVSAIEDQKAAIAASIEKMQTLLDARMQEYFG